MIINKDDLISTLRKTKSKKQLYVVLFEKENNNYFGHIYRSLGKAMQEQNRFVGNSIQIGNMISSNEELINEIESFKK